jgi:hypothetical protein
VGAESSVSVFADVAVGTEELESFRVAIGVHPLPEIGLADLPSMLGSVTSYVIQLQE